MMIQFHRSTKKEKSQSVANQVTQRKPNNTGLPNNLKSGIENLSGYSMDDVKVHYNSSRPAQLQAHAFAQGNQIHLGPGQEKHLPHEAWHVVQQKQGRVKPTFQMKSTVPINDDPGLEKEADVMGSKAVQFRSASHVGFFGMDYSVMSREQYNNWNSTAQRKCMHSTCSLGNQLVVFQLNDKGFLPSYGRALLLIIEGGLTIGAGSYTIMKAEKIETLISGGLTILSGLMKFLRGVAVWLSEGNNGIHKGFTHSVALLESLLSGIAGITAKNWYSSFQSLAKAIRVVVNAAKDLPDNRVTKLILHYLSAMLHAIEVGLGFKNAADLGGGGFDEASGFLHGVSSAKTIRTTNDFAEAMELHIQKDQ